MTTIYKYPFKIDDEVEIKMHAGAKVLSVGLQDGEPHMWCMVDTWQPLIQRTFYVVGTGHQVTRALKDHYLGTLQVPPFVWHVFG